MTTELSEEKGNIGKKKSIVTISEFNDENCFENLTKKIEKDEISKRK